jgi:RNA-splicing ligase RtcB
MPLIKFGFSYKKTSTRKNSFRPTSSKNVPSGRNSKKNWTRTAWLLLTQVLFMFKGMLGEVVFLPRPRRPRGDL